MNPEDYGIGTREIKFRFYHHSSGTMHSWENMVDRWGNHDDDLSIFIPTKGWTPTQYTGLKDKNGKKIYEGDVISEFGGPGIVCFRNECFVCESIKEPGKFLYNWRKGRVIGNVFENPELMK
tara:strand:+ start:1114 stop:1479 length:366 start_codon:yes stop_codon:yes gene_type:complete